MKDMIEARGPVDDIDRTIDALIRESSRSERAAQVPFDKTPPNPDPQAKTALPISDDDDLDEFWDNFPV